MDIQEIQDKLSAPFYADEVEWKIQAKTKDKKRALVVPFIKARALMQRLDDVCGVAGWWDMYTDVVDGVECIITIDFGDKNVFKADAAEYITMTEYVDGKKVSFKSLKGTYSSAFKRTCTKWGIGRYLYDIPKRWIPINEKNEFTPPQLARVFLPEDADTRGLRPGALEPEHDESDPDDAPQQKEVVYKPVKVDDTKVEWAKAHNIPEGIGVPLAGKTLGEALNDPDLGGGIVTFLAKIKPNKSGAYFDPGDNEKLVELHQCAVILYDNVLLEAK
jgi:hypothetical protein